MREHPAYALWGSGQLARRIVHMIPFDERVEFLGRIGSCDPVMHELMASDQVWTEVHRSKCGETRKRRRHRRRTDEATSTSPEAHRCPSPLWRCVAAWHRKKAQDAARKIWGNGRPREGAMRRALARYLRIREEWETYVALIAPFYAMQTGPTVFPLVHVNERRPSRVQLADSPLEHLATRSIGVSTDFGHTVTPKAILMGALHVRDPASVTVQEANQEDNRDRVAKRRRRRRRRQRQNRQKGKPKASRTKRRGARDSE